VARIEVLVGLLVLVLEIYAIANCILTPPSEVRGVPKAVWLIFIVLLPLLGSVLWLGVGRDRASRPARMPRPEYRSDVPPPEVGRGYAALTSDERIRRMEEDLARLEREADEDDGPDKRG
jgi:hypothetical protein